MKIRKAKYEDASQLARLYYQFWQHHIKIDKDMQLKNRLTLKSQVKLAKSELKDVDTKIFVAEVDSKVVGYIEMYVDENPKYMKIKKFALINSAAVDLKYRGQGILGNIWKECLIYLRRRKIKNIHANVYNENPAAISAWTKLGFISKSSLMTAKI